MSHNEVKIVKHQDCYLSYQVQGKGEAIVFIQGAGVHGSGWQPQIEQLASEYSCLSFDNRGIGASQPTGAKLSVEQMSEDVEVLMDKENWDLAHIVGHSMGGLIALDFALTRRKRVKSLSLLCTFAKGADATKLSLWMLWVGLRTKIGTKSMRRNAFLEMVMPKELLVKEKLNELAKGLEPIFGHDLADQPPIVMKQLMAIQNYDATNRLAKLSDIPTLVVSAKHDPIAPPQLGKAIAREIKNSRYIEIAEASHGVTIQCANKVNSLLIENIKAKVAN